MLQYLGQAFLSSVLLVLSLHISKEGLFILLLAQAPILHTLGTMYRVY